MQTMTTRIVGIIGVAVIAVYLGTTSISRGSRTTEAVSSAPADEQAGALARDQPEIRNLSWWNGRIVAHTVGGFQVASWYYWIDPWGAKATPIFTPGDRKLIDVAGGAEKESLALAQEQRNRFVIFVGRGEAWDMHQLPASVSDTQGLPVLAGGPRRVVLANGMIHRHESGRWLQVLIKAGSRNGSKKPYRTDELSADRYLLVGDTLYMAFNRGEWGGTLRSLNVLTGESKFTWTDAPALELPVTDLAVDAKGRVWATEGLSHMGITEGAVRVLENGKWKIFASCGADRGQTAKNWSLPPTAINSIAFDAADRLYLLCNNLGVVRYDHDKWERLTPGWQQVNVSSLIVLDEKTLIIGLYDAGVLVWHLDSGKRERITLAESFDRS